MQMVKHAIEELSRFNPEARLEPELEIQGVSPNTLCVVTSPTFEDKEERLRDEANDLEEELDRYQKSNAEIQEILNSDSTDEEKLKDIQNALA